jgi:hypothetical protein
MSRSRATSRKRYVTAAEASEARANIGPTRLAEAVGWFLERRALCIWAELFCRGQKEVPAPVLDTLQQVFTSRTERKKLDWIRGQRNAVAALATFLRESMGSIFVIAERDGWANALRFDAKNDPRFGRTLKQAAWLEKKSMVGLLQAYPTFEEFKNAVLTEEGNHPR